MSAQKYVVPALLLLTVLLIYRNLYFTIPNANNIRHTIITTKQKDLSDLPITSDQSNKNEIIQEIEQPKKLIQHSVTIENHITKKMLTYKYFVSYSPTKFDLYANNVHLVTLDEKNRPISTNLNQVPLKDNTLVIRYDYEFMNGSRKGAKEVIFEVNPNVSVLNLTFSWKDKWRVVLDNATPISMARIEQ